MMRTGTLRQLLCTALALFLSSETLATEKAILFFDLGDVIIDSRTRGEYKYFEGAPEYLQDLKQAGYSINLASNFVDRMGEQTFSTCEEKFKGMASLIHSRWTGSTPFDWSQFDSIIMPPNDTLRKPMPFVFVNILKASCPSKAVYISENPREIQTSNYLGLATWLVEPGTQQAWPAVDQIENLAATDFRFQYRSQCQINFPNECRLDQASMRRLLDELSLP